jgi:flagellar biosynthesis protein FlhG
MRDQAESLRRLANSPKTEFFIGEDVEVQIYTEPYKGTYKSKIKVIGNNGISITMPQREGSLVNPKKGTPILVYSIARNVSYNGFISESKLEPVPLIRINKIKPNNKKNARVITITSGKGGVGKTNVSVNLSILLKQRGYSVLLFDADIGLANIDIIMGTMPKSNLAHFINNKCDIHQLVQVGPQGISYIAGGSGIKELIDINSRQLKKIVNSLILLEQEYDFIIIDTGAGISNNVTEFAINSDEVIIITTPEPTALTDAYAMIKSILQRNEKIKINIIPNMVEDMNQGKLTGDKLFKTCEKFLKVHLDILGSITKDSCVSEGVSSQVPFILFKPLCKASKDIALICDRILGKEIKENTNIFQSFFEKVFKIFN